MIYNDPMLGEFCLDIDDDLDMPMDWIARVTLPPLSNFENLIEAEPQTSLPRADRLEAARAWVHHFQGNVAAHDELAEKLLRHYRRVRSIYLESPHLLPRGVDADLPDITLGSQIWSLVSAATLHVELRRAKGRRADLSLAMVYDQEHGLVAAYRDEALISLEQV